MPGAGCVLPCGGASPGAVFVRQDVDDLLDELHGRHMVTVFGCPDQVVAHSLLFPFVRRILCTGGLAWKKETKTRGSALGHRAKKMYFPLQTEKMCNVFIHGNSSVSKTK